MKAFNIPEHYRSTRTGALKEWMAMRDPHRKSLAPVKLDFGSISILFPRHFGFCFGVQNAIEKIYTVLENADGRAVYLVSQMIHNPVVNKDLMDKGVHFLYDTNGRELIPLDRIDKASIVVIPAFGIPIEKMKQLQNSELQLDLEDTTCPFVDKVWRRAEQLGRQGFTVVVHGKAEHEETKATFSQAEAHAPAIVIRNAKEAALLASVIKGEQDNDFFNKHFGNKHTNGFDPDSDLKRLGIVNQTTMLASETLEIGNILQDAIKERYGTLDDHFADTRDTLCYATYENQDATRALVDQGADIALVVGGKNSSNTSHLVALCALKMPTLFVTGEAPLQEQWMNRASWFGLKGDIPDYRTLNAVAVTSGASCPDTGMDRMTLALLEMCGSNISWDMAMNHLTGNNG